MARAHLFRPVTDEAGNLLYGATVTVRRADLNDTITQSIYAAPTLESEVLSNPMVIVSGVVDVWLDTPERVNLLITSDGRDPISIYLDAQPPAKEVVRSLYPLVITNAPVVAKVLTGSATNHEASWEDVPSAPTGVAPPHTHASTGLNSLALGIGAVASYTNSAALGTNAVTTADDQIALGTAVNTVLALGEVRALGDVVVSGDGRLLSFFGATPVARQVVDGSDGGDLTLRALLTYLGDLGLIDNQSTEG
jgi:hypothetical protein